MFELWIWNRIPTRHLRVNILHKVLSDGWHHITPLLRNPRGSSRRKSEILSLLLQALCESVPIAFLFLPGICHLSQESKTLYGKWPWVDAMRADTRDGGRCWHWGGASPFTPLRLCLRYHFLSRQRKCSGGGLGCPDGRKGLIKDAS